MGFMSSLRSSKSAKSQRAQAAQVSELSTSGASTSDCTVQMTSAQNGRFTVEGSFVSPLPISVIWSVITDYDNLANVYDNVASSSARMVGGQQQVVQDCRWQFLVFSGTFQTRLAVREEREEGRLTFSLLDGSYFMKDFQGQWQLRSTPDGGCHIVHRLTVQPTVSPPPMFNGYTEKIFCSQITSLLHDLQRELRKHQH